MRALPYDPQAYQLLHDGVVAMSQIEANGVRVDVGYLEKALRKTEKRLARMIEELAGSEVGQVWKKTFGGKTNFNSGEQLGRVLFEEMGYTCAKSTAHRKYSTDEDTLSRVDNPFIKDYIRAKKISKAAGTYLKGILREQVDGVVHGFFHLHSTTTYRGSSDKPNLHNIPVRDEEIMTLIRRAFIAREGNQLVETDFSGAEVRMGACYHKDPVMLDYLADPDKDMHRDMAMELFKLPVERLDKRKQIRHRAKNMFVFPEFYGDWYVHCAQQLWDETATLYTEDEVLLRTHLAGEGITELGSLDPKDEAGQGTFVYHVKQVENDFWERRFRVYSQWKRDWYNAYLKQGWFKTLTGFICQGVMDRKAVINYPVQGSAFHCMLWVLIQLVRTELQRRGMRTLIVNQIHDSIVADCPPEERDDYIAIVNRFTTKKLQRHWPHLIVPMEMEAEVCPVGGTWADKSKYKLPE